MRHAIKDLKFDLKKSREKGIKELAESVRRVGVIEPIVVTPEGQVISGGRRVTAARLAGLKDVPTTISRRNAIETRIAQLDANLMVLPLNSAEFDAQLLERKKLNDQVNGKRSGFTSDTAKRLGVSKRTIEKAIRRSRTGIKGVSKSKLDQLARLPKPNPGLTSFAATHTVKQLREKIDRTLRKGPRLVNAMDTIESHVDALETLFRDIMSGRIEYEHRNGKFTKSLEGLEKLLHRFIKMNRAHISEKHLRRVA